MGLNEEQRRWLGSAIAVAKADGVLKLQERKLIDQICDALKLTSDGRVEVEAMLQTPPTPVELASWAIGAKDRVQLYRVALTMAEADGDTAAHESALLGCLAAVLKLTPEERAAARRAP